MAATPSVNNRQIDTATITKPVLPDLSICMDAALLISAKLICPVSKKDA